MFDHSFALEPLSGHLASHAVFLYPLHPVACCLTEGAIVSEIAKKSHNGVLHGPRVCTGGSLRLSAGQLSQLAAESNPQSSLWETPMSHLRYSTPVFTGPRHTTSALNNPNRLPHTHTHAHTFGGPGNLDPGLKIDDAGPSFATTDETLRSCRPRGYHAEAGKPAMKLVSK